jgi:alpha-ribazole phosphatase
VRLFLIRHPRPAVADGLCYGATDLPLADDPQTAAAALHRQLRAAWPVDSSAQFPAGMPLFSSPLQRCAQFAQRLASQLNSQPVTHDARLAELDFGTWEMRAWDDIGGAALAAWAADPLHHVPPGGESVAALQRRVLAFLAELQASNIPAALLVTHAGVMKVLYGHARQLPPEIWMQTRFAHGELVAITC